MCECNWCWTFEKRGSYDAKQKKSKKHRTWICVRVLVFLPLAWAHAKQMNFHISGFDYSCEIKIIWKLSKIENICCGFVWNGIEKKIIEHCSAATSMKGHSSDLILKNAQCSCSRGTITADGVGSTRACKHRVRGN